MRITRQASAIAEVVPMRMVPVSLKGPTTDRSLLLSLELCECHTTSEVSKYVFKFGLLYIGVDNAAADQGTTCSTFILPR